MIGNTLGISGALSENRDRILGQSFGKVPGWGYANSRSAWILQSTRAPAFALEDGPDLRGLFVFNYTASRRMRRLLSQRFRQLVASFSLLHSMQRDWCPLGRLLSRWNSESSFTVRQCQQIYAPFRRVNDIHLPSFDMRRPSEFTRALAMNSNRETRVTIAPQNGNSSSPPLGAESPNPPPSSNPPSSGSRSRGFPPPLPPHRTTFSA